MKKLFTLLAVSLVMMACNKEAELTSWDKIVAEMTRTDKSVSDVLNSLQENEFWYQNASSSYYYKDGEEIEVVYQQEGELLLDGPTMRFVDNSLYYFHAIGPELSYTKYDAKDGGKNIIKFFYEDKEVGEWKIIAYDDNKLLVEHYFLQPQDNHPVYGEFLYSKKMYIRKAVDNPWWRIFFDPQKE